MGLAAARKKLLKPLKKKNNGQVKGRPRPY